MYGRCVTSIKIGPAVNNAFKRYCNNNFFLLQHQLQHPLFFVHLPQIQEKNVGAQQPPQSTTIDPSNESTIYGKTLSSKFLSLRMGVLSFRVTTAAMSKANMYSISIPIVTAMLKTCDFEFLISIYLVL